MKNFVCLLIALVVVGVTGTEACQNVQAGIFTNSPTSFVVKAKVSNDPIHNKSFDNVCVTVFWEKSFGITPGTVSSPYGIVQGKGKNDQDFLDLENAFIAGKGTTVVPQAYSYVDNTAPTTGEHAYRLKQQDLDGTVHYTGIVIVQVTVTGVAEVVPQAFHLTQNYPNPFNPSTTIGYRVPGTGNGHEAMGNRWVRLGVYDLLGHEVAVLVNEQRAPGGYSVEFNAVGLPSGAYCYRLTVGNNTDVKRMLLVR